LALRDMEGRNFGEASVLTLPPERAVKVQASLDITLNNISALAVSRLGRR
jgi:hypothetical protein